MTNTEKLFRLSIVNGADNFQEMLPTHSWAWPRSTWLSRRRSLIKASLTTEIERKDNPNAASRNSKKRPQGSE